MLKKEIFAAGINNLSDARYFAAWGARYMSFPFHSEANLKSIKEMIDWVEGPETVGEVETLDLEEDLIEQIRNLDFDHLMIPPFYSGFLPPGFNFVYQSMGNEDSPIISNVSVIKFEQSFDKLKEGDIDRLNNYAEDSEVYIDLPFKASDVESMVALLPKVGLVLRGGEEEKVGVKSFEDLDDIIEQLEF